MARVIFRKTFQFYKTQYLIETMKYSPLIIRKTKLNLEKVQNKTYIHRHQIFNNQM